MIISPRPEDCIRTDITYDTCMDSYEALIFTSEHEGVGYSFSKQQEADRFTQDYKKYGDTGQERALRGWFRRYRFIEN